MKSGLDWCSSPCAKLIAAIVITFALLGQTAQAQRPQDGSDQTSELTRMNLSRVAASAAQIRAVLATNAGLMVTVKQWVARDAATHGQIVRDEDLTDDAIFTRLDTDTEFRSVTTALLQKYGYLVPDLNPQSDAAKEHQILVQERGRLLAEREARQEQQLTAAQSGKTGQPGRSGQPVQSARLAQPMLPGQPAQQAQPGTLQGPLRAASCDSQLTEDCNPTPEDFGDSDTGILTPPPDALPDLGTRPRIPGPNAPPNGGAQLTPIAQTNSDTDASGVFSAFLGGDRTSSNQANRAYDDQATVQPLDNLDGAIGGIGQAGLSGREVGFTTASPALGVLSPETVINNQPLPPARPPAPVHPPELVRKPNPYRDVPSLFDMYVQTTTDPEHPKRFGADIFLNGTRDLKTIPMDLPAGPNYIVGPGDSLTIDLWGSVAQRISRTVDREGRVSVPQAGPILVSGKNLADVQLSLQQALRSQFRSVSADVSLARLRTVRVYEVGDVTKPGAYDVSSLSTPLSALFLAGGPTPSGSLRVLKHYRGNRLVQTVDVYDLLLHGVKGNIEQLENGDTIEVPTIGPQVTVEGMVRRPAIYELRDEKTLAEVLDLAGGLLPVAALRHIEVQRIVEHQKQDLLSLDIPDSDSDAEATRKMESFQIQDGDEVRVFPIAPYNENAIFIAGHVARPGKYAYREGMRVTDLISSYQDLLPEPARQHAEIIHLNPPDYWPSVQSFDLAEALADPAKAPLLHPLDTVRIFSRFDFEDPPSVSVGGEVRVPGTYPTPGQVRLVDAIDLAGGLKPGAETDDVQVLRYLPEGTLRIFSVNLAGALKGASSENIVLEPRDQILIHRNPNEVAPAAVYLQGLVVRPGHYPLSANMRVSDLIRVGGGLVAGADAQTADLTRHDWSGQQELQATSVPIALSAALKGDVDSDVPLHNGDVLTIRQIPGWNDLGATISVKGEVKNPGIYGIRPGERLSSVLERAGGFQPDSYPYGAVLQRTQVRELESKAQVAMVLRVKDSQNTLELLPDKDPAQKQAKEATLQQWQSTLDQLAANPPIGRVAVRIGPDIKVWQNTAADIEVRAGDTITIPKKPSYVMVTGQVFNATAIAFRPGKSANWYLSQAGGPTPLANRKGIFVIRADGSVIGAKKSLLAGDSLNSPLRPGDTVVVPEKPFGGPFEWQTVFSAAQIASAVASTVFIALRY